MQDEVFHLVRLHSIDCICWKQRPAAFAQNRNLLLDAKIKIRETSKFDLNLTDKNSIEVQTELGPSCKMSNLLHGPISSNQILPREKRANRDKTELMRFLVMNKCG